MIKGKKSICILLPKDFGEPIGGYKVVYEYVNRFSDDGYSVTIEYVNNFLLPAYSFMYKCRLIHGYIHNLLFGKKHESVGKWFELRPAICKKTVGFLNKFNLSRSDIYISTAVETAYTLNRIRTRRGSKRFYFIQGYEDWVGGEQFVEKTYHYPMRKIVVSSWLQDLLKSHGEDSVMIPNGLDFYKFSLSNPINKRLSTEIVCMYHQSPNKGWNILEKALEIVKNNIKELHVSVFGVFDPPSNLDSWMTYYQKPDSKTHRELYNNASIYVAASYKEGFGLTVAEAMACGCAVACTDCKGYLEMAKNENTALVSSVGDASGLAYNIIRLINDDALRHSIAHNGNDYVQRFNWDTSYKLLKQTIEADDL